MLQQPYLTPDLRQQLREAIRALPPQIAETLENYSKIAAILDGQAPFRTATSIEVGPHEGRVGIRLTFEDGQAEVFLFDRATATSIFHQGLAVVEALHQAESPPDQSPTSHAGLSDYAQVRLVKPGE